ncbi:substrate-binding domain-containing protein [Fusobacterium sp.]|uniref:substrate-binding domain-containing protein n=1 Tax=Fusobacterium sp. TaxID=68766 RepID=UPI00396C5E11
MITQKEIAERLGVSRTTVARAINGSSLIKEETKRKILELVKETNYEKNYIGSSLGSKKSKKVCALVVESKNQFYTQEIKRGIEESVKEFRAYNYNVEIITTDINDPQSQLEELKKVVKRKDLDGIIITPLDNEKVYKVIKGYLDKIKIISLGIGLHENIPHVGPDHIKQGKIAAGIMANLLRSGEKLLVIDNGDDKVSSKLYLQGFLDRIKETDIEIVGPVEGHGIETSIELITDTCEKDDIKGIYINRYAHDILAKLPKTVLQDKKVVTNGIGRIIKSLIKKHIITATVMEEICSEGYSAGKKMFEILCKEKNFNNLWDISKSRIIFYENLED